mmetsp:Transcript_21638/g.26066  ORF Transcript_21638/g.26066 Transcript_21638/m.26066 type:complete len:186 (-) Transcript_21638:353-910(-)
MYQTTRLVVLNTLLLSFVVFVELPGVGGHYHITTYEAEYSGKSCFVGPYGWTCDPSDVELDVKYYTAPQWEGIIGWYPPEQECCTAECLDTYFDQRNYDLKIGTFTDAVSTTYFVNFYNGSDTWPGSRQHPWKTLQKAQSVVRSLRQKNQVAVDSMKLAEPVQIWLKDYGEDQFSSRYNGISYFE